MGPRYRLICDAMQDALALEPENSIDACVTDPPYELAFMGKAWDASGVSFSADTWRAVLRVLKPGGHLVAFGGTRTWHRIAVAIEDAGFEVRDSLAWMYGSGFPKSLDVRRVTGDDAFAGIGTALKPAFEPVILARKPLDGTVAANAQRWGTGGINVDACRIGASGGCRSDSPASEGYSVVAHGGSLNSQRSPPVAGLGRWPANVLLDDEAAAMLDEQSGTISSGAPAAQRGTGGIWGAGNGVPVGPQYGDSDGASRFFYCAKADGSERDAGLEALPPIARAELVEREDDSAGMANPRAGAGRTSSGRRNLHPTVKPIDLMRYLARLVTPRGGVVLDPFAGSGTTMVAAIAEGFDVLGVELDTKHACIAWHRAEAWAKAALAPDVDGKAAARAIRKREAAAVPDLFAEVKP